jgi:hypothetical protein
MSNFRQQKTNINDQQSLTDALKTLGYTPQVNKEKVSVRGHGYETKKAEIILRKEDLKNGGDIGFSKSKDGSFEIVTDTYVMRNFNLDEFTSKVKKQYAEEKIKATAKKHGLVLMGRQVIDKNGQQQVKVVYRLA